MYWWCVFSPAISSQTLMSFDIVALHVAPIFTFKHGHT